MIVSWNWLKEYVDLTMSVDELTERLTLSGLNLEGVEKIGDDDVAIDLEVTSNRPDCLGHIGVAREIAVLWNQPLKRRHPLQRVRVQPNKPASPSTAPTSAPATPSVSSAA